MSKATASEATARALELPTLLRLIAHLAATDLGRERVLALSPLADEELLRERRQRYEESERLLGERPLVPYSERPFAPLLSALEGDSHKLTGRDIVALGDLLRASAEVRERLASSEAAYEALERLAASLPDDDGLRREIRKTFDARGEIREDASPALATLRRRTRKVRGQLYSNLSSLVDRHREHLSEETIPLRGGRLVMVLQSGARGRLPGLVHGRSASGKSFYFEPFETVELNNELQQTIEDEAEERRRILRELIARLRAEMPTLQSHTEFVAELDCLQASARFAEACDGRLAELGGRYQLRLTGARHPLLDPSLADLRQQALDTAGHRGSVVPLELELSADQRALVVTGPNAGGKTVALKTLGLLTLAHLCALPVPVAAGSRLPVLRAVVATVGDDQDLLADRSTFSGRLVRLAEAWEAGGEDALLLLDELGSGTDPQEGAAISVALLEGLLEKRCLTFITTHLTQLAAAAMESEDAGCAAMQFDPGSGQPTYRLLPGPPGGSEALALARRLGLPSRWLDRAEELLGSDHQNLQRLLAEVERGRQQLEAEHQRLEQEVADAERLRRRLAEREEALASERKAVGKRLQQQLDAFRDQVSAQLREEVEKLRQEPARAARKKPVVAQTVRELFEEAPILEPESAAEAEVRLGGRVRHRLLGWEGVLEKLEKGKAQVRFRGKILRCGEGDLVGLAAAGDEPKVKRAAARKEARERSGDSLEDSGPAPELMLVGMRVEPALETLDRYLDSSLLGSHREVRVVHGFGSGKLREAVRRHLRGHPAADGQRPGKGREGGDGATVVRLRGAE